MKKLFAIAFFISTLVPSLLAQPGQAYTVEDDVAIMQAYQKENHPQAAKQMYAAAVNELTAGHFRRARLLSQDLIKQQPDCAGAYAVCASCQTWFDFNLDSVEKLNRAIVLSPDQPLYYYRKALSHLAMMQFPEAINEVKRGLLKKPDDAELIRLRARCYRTMHNGDKAIEDFSRLIELKKHTVEALCERGTLYSNQGKTAEALKDFGQAIELDPDCSLAFAGRAEIYMNAKDWRNAADNYTAALGKKNDFWQFYTTQRDLASRKSKMAK
jgi:tetratricopeptide (TPR) repeat protein